MKNTLLLTKKHTHFLEENRQDPITGDSFQLGDKIVFCAECKSAFLEESWEYMGAKHCNQRQTFYQIPKTKKIEARREVESKYKIPFAPNLFTYWLIDTIIYFLIILVVWFLTTDYLDTYSDYFKIFMILMLLLKDNNLLVTSVGKKSRGVAIVYTKSHKKLNPIFYPLRHIFSAICLTLLLYFETLIFVFIFLTGVDLFQSLTNYKRGIDYIFGTALRQDKAVARFDLPDYESVNQDSFGEGYNDPTRLDEF